MSSTTLRRRRTTAFPSAALPVVQWPDPKGPLSHWVLRNLFALSGASSTLREDLPRQAAPMVRDDGWSDDLHLALYLCHDLHIGGLPGVDPELEWSPKLIAFRSQLEAAFVAGLRLATGAIDVPTVDGLRDGVVEMLNDDRSPSLSSFMYERGTLDHMRQIVLHRSAYQLAEGDFHSFAIPRLLGDAKRSLVRIQAGEYGCDAPDREMHSTLFARAMRSLGLDDRRHAHLDELPASAMALSNMISTFGLHRRWRAALAGQLAAFELTSVEPMRRYGSALRRLGASPDACRFYDVHVLADAEHEQWGLDMIEHLARDEPAVIGDVMFGVASTIEVERRFALDLLDQFDRWDCESSGQLEPSTRS